MGGTISVRKRGNTWEYRFYISNNGKRKQISKSGFRRKSDAYAAGAKAFSEAQDTLPHIAQSGMTLADYLALWQQEYCRYALKETTILHYEKKLKNHILPALGTLPLEQITPVTLQRFIDSKFDEGYSRNTLNDFRCILSGAFRYAMETYELLTRNPASVLRLPSTRAKPRQKTRTKERTYVTKEDWERLLERFPEESSCHIPLRLGYHLGLRLGEAFGLLWEDVDFEKHCITVRRQIQYNEQRKQWCFTAPKFDSVRTVMLDDVLEGVLQKAYARQIAGRCYYGERWTCLRMDEDGVLGSVGKEVFPVCRRDDGTFTQPRITMHMSRVIHYQMNMPTFDFHSLRHPYVKHGSKNFRRLM